MKTLKVPGQNFERSQVVDLTASGSFTGGTVLVHRVGQCITISVLTDLTHVSASVVASAVAAIPSWARPAANKTNIYGLATVQLHEITIGSDGTLTTSYFDNAFAASNKTSSGTFCSITFVVV